MWCNPLHLTKLYCRILGRDTSLIHTVRSSRASWSKELKTKKAFGLLVADWLFHSIKPCVKIFSTSAQLSGTFQIWQDICCLTRCILLAQYAIQFGKFLCPWVQNSRISMRLSSTLWSVDTDGSKFRFYIFRLDALAFGVGSPGKSTPCQRNKDRTTKPTRPLHPLTYTWWMRWPCSYWFCGTLVTGQWVQYDLYDDLPFRLWHTTDTNTSNTTFSFNTLGVIVHIGAAEVLEDTDRGWWSCQFRRSGHSSTHWI